jgi:hypothetical protein
LTIVESKHSYTWHNTVFKVTIILICYFNVAALNILTGTLYDLQRDHNSYKNLLLRISLGDFNRMPDKRKLPLFKRCDKM